MARVSKAPAEQRGEGKGQEGELGRVGIELKSDKGAKG